MPSLNVLLVDDDLTALTSLAELIRTDLGEVNVETAVTSRSALARLGYQNFDAVVSDIKMPGMDGLELLAAIGRQRPGLPVILVSGYADYDLAIQALRNGAYDLIEKPIEPRYFVGVLQSAFLVSRARKLQQQPLSVEAEEQVLLAGTSVLVVDDSFTARVLLDRLLTRQGAKVLAAASVSEALQLISEGQPDVLVSDLRMPGEDGYALMGHLRQQPASMGGNIPALALTAHSDEEACSRALRAGFQQFLPKEVGAQVLASVVADLAAGRKANRSGVKSL